MAEPIGPNGVRLSVIAIIAAAVSVPALNDIRFDRRNMDAPRFPNMLYGTAGARIPIA
jgi:hypothetical protein